MEGLPELIELIEVATRYLDNQSATATFPWTQIIELVIPLAAIVTSAVTAIYAVHLNWKLQEANSRIEQLRELRKIVAELNDICSRVIQYRTQEVQNEALSKIELLILYFDYDGGDLDKDVDLLDKTSNIGKNDAIVNLLHDVSRDVILFCYAEKYEKALANNIAENVKALRNIMRIYLKIEWEKAKKGK